MVAHVGVLSCCLPSTGFLHLFQSRRNLHRPFAMAALSDDPIRDWILTEGKAKHITRISPVGGGCINFASRYETDAGSFFVKTNRRIGPSMFEGEALGLSAMYRFASPSHLRLDHCHWVVPTLLWNLSNLDHPEVISQF